MKTLKEDFEKDFPEAISWREQDSLNSREYTGYYNNIYEAYRKGYYKAIKDNAKEEIPKL